MRQSLFVFALLYGGMTCIAGVLGNKLVALGPLAVEAGAKILGAGGSAADAMVAVQSVLGLVEPESSGLGGGSFVVWYDAESGQVTTLDARETAPRGATPQLFLDDKGEPLEFMDAVVGGRSVGTPGRTAGGRPCGCCSR